MNKTLTFSEDNRGWTSFWSYSPDGMCSVDNRFYSVKNGQLYLHNDQDNPIPNTFYGVYTPSKLKFYFNEDPTNDKIFKTIEIEGTHAWETLLKTNLSNGTIYKNEFNKKESRYYAYTRKNEDDSDLHGNATQGIGGIIAVNTINNVRTITYNNLPEQINVGDKLYQLNLGEQEYLGVINTINFTTGQIVVIIPTPPRTFNSKFNFKFGSNPVINSKFNSKFNLKFK